MTQPSARMTTQVCLGTFEGERRSRIMESTAEPRERAAILIVDDEPRILKSLSRSLAAEGFEIHQAGSGQRALEILETVAVSVVISDQRMPGLSGIDLLSQVKERWPHIERIIVTGYTDPTELCRAVDRGIIRGWLPKPWNREELCELVNAAVSSARARDGD